jgi:hypothetical protein
MLVFAVPVPRFPGGFAWGDRFVIENESGSLGIAARGSRPAAGSIAAAQSGSAGPDREVVAAPADVAQMHERDVRPGEHLPDDGQGLVAVVGENAVGDVPLPVVGAHHLLAVDQPGRVTVRRRVSPAGISVDEHGPAFGVRAGGAGRRVGDEQDQFAGTALAEAAAQRIVAMWLAVLFVGVFGQNFVSNNSGVNATIIPSAIFIALFACIATASVAKRGFRRDSGRDE